MINKQNIVVKVGTNVLTTDEDDLDFHVIGHLVGQIAKIKEEGHNVILVSSGAVGAGKTRYTLKNESDETIRRQVYSAIGQVTLMTTYSEMFSRFELITAQVLATKEDFIGIEAYRNMQNCFEALLKDDIVPIVNENDVVSIDELMFTDNDELAGLTAFMVKADKLILLTNVDGLYPNSERKAGEMIDVVGAEEEIDPTFGSKSEGGRGGMESKVEVALRLREKGIETYIANGNKKKTILKIFNGEKEGTKFEAQLINA